MLLDVSAFLSQLYLLVEEELQRSATMGTLLSQGRWVTVWFAVV
jgi:hypothetical protein